MKDVTDTRQAFQDLFDIYVPIAGVVFLIVLGALVVIAVRFRARPGREPETRTTSTRLETGYAVALGLVAALLVVLTFRALQDADPVPARGATGERAVAQTPAALTIGIVASRWNWRFTYPGGVAQTGDGRTRYAVLVVPDDQPVRFRLTSKDVVHAFWVPALRAKYDAVPGWTNAFALRFPAGHDYTTSRCSEFCGEYHDEMQLRVDVRSPAAFGAWLRERQVQARAVRG